MLDKALCDFVGFGQEKYPKENQELILSRYGEAIHESVQKIMSVFESELTNNPNLELGGALRLAKNEVSLSFPEVGDAGLDALEWAFSYWFK
jgi:hypothetical protein